jgi:hypothetical protein
VIVSIMQPYYFPYIGYFQLIAASDTFVLYDDVQYSKGGWANRNRILADGSVTWLTLPVGAAPLGSSYQQKTYLLGDKQRKSHLQRIESAYGKAPYFNDVFPEIQTIMAFGDERVASFNANLIRHIAGMLGITTSLVLGSGIANYPPERGQRRIIRVCEILSASIYLNAIGGVRLYDEDAFARSGLTLRFLQPSAPRYPQRIEGFAPFLSIIDVLMNNSLASVRGMLSESNIITPAQALADNS